MIRRTPYPIDTSLPNSRTQALKALLADKKPAPLTVKARLLAVLRG